jgi:hypothetical protein
MSPAVIVCGSLNMDLVARVDHLPRAAELASMPSRGP